MWRLNTRGRLETERGVVCVDGIHFLYVGGQVRSSLSVCSYVASCEYRNRYLGVKIPPTNIGEYHLKAASKFANGPADRLVVAHGSEILHGVK